MSKVEVIEVEVTGISKGFSSREFLHWWASLTDDEKVFFTVNVQSWRIH